MNRWCRWYISGFIVTAATHACKWNGTFHPSKRNISSQFFFHVLTRHHFVVDQLTHNEPTQQETMVVVSISLTSPFKTCIFIARSNWAHFLLCVMGIDYKSVVIIISFFFLFSSFFRPLLIENRMDPGNCQGNKFLYLNCRRRRKVENIFEKSYRYWSVHTEDGCVGTCLCACVKIMATNFFFENQLIFLE
jgi:hypothetical protein